MEFEMSMVNDDQNKNIQNLRKEISSDKDDNKDSDSDDDRL